MKEEIKYGITLAKYTELIVKTINANETMCKKIINDEGLDYEEWIKAKKEWDEKINDPGDEGNTYSKFLPLYQSELERNYFGGIPCSLEKFAKIHCELSFRRDPEDPTKPIKYDKVLETNRISINKWEICNSFWTVRVGLPDYRKRFSELVRIYSKFYMTMKLEK